MNRTAIVLLLYYIVLPCTAGCTSQVGPDDLRSNVLLQLLVHLGKRDAFNVLRTQQQVGQT